jgi:hypothetical protein
MLVHSYVDVSAVPSVEDEPMSVHEATGEPSSEKATTPSGGMPLDEEFVTTAVAVIGTPT